MLILALVAAGLVGLTIYDLLQKRHAILRNFPIVGHFRYLLEKVGPELRQYIVTSNDEERPFSRDQRTWVYASAKAENNYSGFGTDNDLERGNNYLIIKHDTLQRGDFGDGKVAEDGDEAGDGARGRNGAARAGLSRDSRDDRIGGDGVGNDARGLSGARLGTGFGSGRGAKGGSDASGTRIGRSDDYPLACRKVLGGHRGRRLAFRPRSAVNVSGMSFGSLSAAAVEAMNRGALLAGCLHNTGEGGIAPHHLHGGELVWQLGTGYFGARGPEGRFDQQEFLRKVDRHPVRAVEVKLSQGAKPGLGGVLPAEKVTAEIARIRGVPMGRSVISPAHHPEFATADELLDFVEGLADFSGLPVGIKSAVGRTVFWEELADLMAGGDRGVDFITIDGGEGGTGAAPFSFADHVALPFKIAFSRVYRIFAERGIHRNVVWIGSGKLGFPSTALLAFCLGADMVAVGREAMMAVGCIQAQRCHTGHCPTGVATHNRWLVRGLDPTSKAARMANYIVTLRKELTLLSRACGVPHPGLLTADHMEILDGRFGGRSIREVFGYEESWELPPTRQAGAVEGFQEPG